MELSDAQVAEIQWASSEQGMAAVKAACDLARSLGVLGTRAYLTESDVGAIVYAAYLAAEHARTLPARNTPDNPRTGRKVT
jgi:hypothetical protein